MNQKIINPVTGRSLLLVSTQKSFFDVVTTDTNLELFSEEPLEEQLNIPFNSKEEDPHYHTAIATLDPPQEPIPSLPPLPSLIDPEKPVAMGLGNQLLVWIFVYALILNILWALIQYKVL